MIPVINCNSIATNLNVNCHSVTKLTMTY